MNPKVEESMRVARMHAVIDQARSDMLDVKQTALAKAIEIGDEEGAAELARSIRDKLLAESDKEMVLDRMGLQVPDGSNFTAWLGFLRKLGETLANDWSTYRQKLRDIPRQEGFPFYIEWPTSPDSAETPPEGTSE